MDLHTHTLGQPSSPPLARSAGGRSVSRSRSGCWTCRTKKVKCDEGRPQCQRCLRLKLLCDYMPKRSGNKIGRRAIQSQRRRRGSDTNEINTAHQASPTSDWFQAVLEKSNARSISTFRMSTPSTSSSSVALTATDHEAIRYFRTTFATLHHTKNPEYSLYSIMFKIAEVNPLVMHMVLALGGREMAFQRKQHTEHERGAGSPLWHYSNALGLMADLIGSESAIGLNSDSIYTALYLMLLYEQKYGDERCAGLINHLEGVALILEHQYGDKLGLIPPVSGAHQQLALSHADESNQNHYLSLYAARIIMWMVQIDTSAASNGVDSRLHAALYKLMSSNTSDTQADTYIRPLEKFEQLHHFSSSLYRAVWGKNYPQIELLHDIENRNIFFMEGACSQLRYMVSQLSTLRECETEMTERWASDLQLSIDSIGDKFCDLIEVAAGLAVSTDNSNRLVANIRRVVPLYYAIILYFLRLRSSPEQSLATRQLDALRQIMNMAFQAHKYDGEKAMVRIAWPLFMVALETNDHLHREWVLDRFGAISKFGLNFQRAHQLLVSVVDLQSRSRRRVDLRGKLQSEEFGLFVI